MRPRWNPDLIWAFACFTAVALSLAGLALAGRGALDTEQLLDGDALYRTGPPPPPPRIGDHTGIVVDYPRDLAFARGLWAGRLDQWNPLVGCGFPLWADHLGPFFPLKLPFQLAPALETYSLFLALRLVFAAFGSYFLARRHGLAHIAAIAAGASFEACGSLVAGLSFGTVSPIYVLPWVVLGATAIATDRTPTAVVGAAVALGLAGSGGHPTLALLMFAAFAAALAGHLVAHWRRPRAALPIAACSLVALAIGLALAAPTLLPLADLTGHGATYKYRAVGAAIRAGVLGDARSGLPIALFAPGAIGELLPRFATLLPFGAAIGVLGVTTATAGLLWSGFEPALTAVLALAVALALEPPGLAWTERIPGVLLILPTYVFSLIALFLAQAAGRGVQAVAAGRGSRVLPAAFALVLAGGLSLLLIRDPRWARFLNGALASRDGAARLLLPALFASIAVAVLSMAGRKRRAPACAACLALLIPLEEIALMLPLARQPRSEVLRSAPSPAVAFLQEHLRDGNSRMIGLPYQVGYPLTPMLFGLPDLRNVSGMPLRRFHQYLEAIHAGSADRAVGVFTVPVATSPLLDLAAVRYVVTTPADNAARSARNDPALAAVYRDDRVVVYENRSALPRVRIAHHSVAVASASEAADWLKKTAALLRHAGDGILASTVVLEPDEDGRAAVPMSGVSKAEESVRIEEQPDPDRLLLEAKLDEPGLVVIADAYDPGWKARLDGAPAPLHPADLLFRAVAVPAGTHAIELRYEPRAFRVGVVLFATAVVASGLLLATAWRRRFAPPARHPGPELTDLDRLR